jgi:hypothetical protein
VLRFALESRRFLAKAQSIREKRLVVVQLVNMPTRQDIGFQIFGRGGDKDRRTRPELAGNIL